MQTRRALNVLSAKKIIATENHEQRALVAWFRLQYPHLEKHLIKLNNEGKRSPLQGFNLKRMGMVPGASDLFLAIPRKGFGGLWLEVKRQKKYYPSERLTPSWLAEEAFQKAMNEVGYETHFCYGWENGKCIIDEYMS